MSVLYLLIGWFVGIWLGAQLSGTVGGWLALAAICLLPGLIWRRRPYGLLLLSLTTTALGAARYTTAVPQINESHIAWYNGSNGVTLTGIVSSEPDVHDRFTNLRLRVTAITLRNGATTPVSGLVLLRTLPYPPIPYGAQVTAVGDLQTPPENSDFSYRDYLARQGIHSLMPTPRLSVQATDQGHPIYHAIYAFKLTAQATIARQLPDPQAALLTGILLGNDNGLPPDLAEDFRTTGMTHIIAISGFNIAILIALLVSLSEPFLGRRGAAVFAMIGIALYTIMVGADASVVRAAIMGSLYLFTNRWLGRPNVGFVSLFAAGFVMTLINPYTLWDVGFQLSFAATLSLMLYADPFTQWTHRHLRRLVDRKLARQIMNVLSEAVIITLAAQVLTLPLLVAYFRQLSLVSLPANALILPAQPAVMIWGGASTLAGMALPSVGQWLAYIAWIFLTYTIALVRMFAAVPFAAIPVELPMVGLVAIYALIGGVTWWHRQEPEARADFRQALRQHGLSRVAWLGLLVGVVLSMSWYGGQPDGRLHVAFLDVGQGDAIFIQTPSGRQILIDGGYYPSVLNEQLGRQLPFWDRDLDLIIATHPDADHVSGLVDILGRYRVGELWTDGSGLGESAVYDAVLQAAEETGTPIRRAVVGETLAFGDGVRLEVLHPGESLSTENRNDNSVSVRLLYGDFSLLLTGDAEEAGERALLDGGRPLQALVFKAGHHGSRTSSSAELLTAVQPQIIVISAGVENRFGHPHPEVLQRAADIGAVVLRTDELGTIEVKTDGRRMWWTAVP
jgi:competence protein ComEC